MIKLAVLALFASMACCSTALAAPKHHKAAVQADYKIVGYYLDRADPKRHFAADKLKAAHVTHINYAFAGIKDGVVVLGETLPEQQSREDLAALVKLRQHNPRLQVLVSIGGWAGSHDFSDVALTPEARLKFADSAVAFMKQYRLDGVDIDWEFPVHGGDDKNIRRPEDRENYTWLFHALRDRLDAAGAKDKRHYLLTAAIGNNVQFLKDTEMDKVAQILDWANIMTYDFSGAWNPYAGHHAPLYDDPMIKHGSADTHELSVDFIVSETLKAGVPPAKLVLGVPFYGYSWKQCGASNNGQLQDCHGKGRGTWEDGVLDYSDIEANLTGQKGFVRYWNDHAKAPYLFNNDTGEFVTYDDPQSLGHKIDYIKSHELGGAMFWEFTGDRKGTLQNKLASGLRGR